MFPIGDHNPSGDTPYVTYALIAVNVVIFGLSQIYANTPAAQHQVYDTYAMIPAEISMGQGCGAFVNRIDAFI